MPLQMQHVLDTSVHEIRVRGVVLDDTRDVWLLASFERWEYERWCTVGLVDGCRKSMRKTVEALMRRASIRESAERFVAALGLPWEQMRPHTIQALWGAVLETLDCDRARQELEASSIEELLALRGLLTREVLAMPDVLAMVNTYKRGVQ